MPFFHRQFLIRKHQNTNNRFLTAIAFFCILRARNPIVHVLYSYIFDEKMHLRLHEVMISSGVHSQLNKQEAVLNIAVRLLCCVYHFITTCPSEQLKPSVKSHASHLPSGPSKLAGVYKHRVIRQMHEGVCGCSDTNSFSNKRIYANVYKHHVW